MEKRRVVRGICPLRQNLLWVGQLRCVVWLHPEFLVHGLKRTQRALTKCQYWAVHTTVPWPSPRGAYYQSKKKTHKIWLSRIERYEWGRLSKGNKECSVLMEGKHSPWAQNRPAGQESLRGQKGREGTRRIWSPGTLLSGILNLEVSSILIHSNSHSTLIHSTNEPACPQCNLINKYLNK